MDRSESLSELVDAVYIQTYHLTASVVLLKERTEIIECGKVMITSLRNNYSTEIVIFVEKYSVNRKTDSGGLIIGE